MPYLPMSVSKDNPKKSKAPTFFFFPFFPFLFLSLFLSLCLPSFLLSFLFFLFYFLVSHHNSYTHENHIFKNSKYDEWFRQILRTTDSENYWLPVSVVRYIFGTYRYCVVDFFKIGLLHHNRHNFIW